MSYIIPLQCNHIYQWIFLETTSLFVLHGKFFVLWYDKIHLQNFGHSSVNSLMFRLYLVKYLVVLIHISHILFI